MTAQEILKLIEEVSPGDTAKLDEIDARVDAWIGGKNFNFLVEGRSYSGFVMWASDEVFLDGGKRVYSTPCFTRSRDALKAIRPTPYDHKTGGYQDAWYFQILPNGDGDWRCDFGKQGANPNGKTPYFHTEELAELHAIIQAIEYERNNA